MNIKLRERNAKFKKECLIENFLKTKTGRNFDSYKREHLPMRALSADFKEEELDLFDAAIKTPDESFFISKYADLDIMGQSICSAKGKMHLIRSKENIARFKAQKAHELKKEKASREYSKYLASESYLLIEELQKMDSGERNKLKLQAFLIGRVIKGESIMHIKTKEYDDFLEEA